MSNNCGGDKETTVKAQQAVDSDELEIQELKEKVDEWNRKLRKTAAQYPTAGGDKFKNPRMA